MILTRSFRAENTRSACFVAMAALSLAATQAPATAHGSPGDSTKPVKPAVAVLKPLTAPIRLTYAYKPGDVRRFKVTGFFSGHFPPFATAGSPPIHLMTLLDYVATVKKVSDKGAEVEFNVENASLSLLEQEPGPDAHVDAKDAAEFPVPLSQVQKMFNATATFKPNGTVTDIQGGDTSSVKIDLGIDLRKLFLVTAPIAFADNPVKAGDTWPFSDGLLGSKAGKTTYVGRLQDLGFAGKKIVATVSQQAESTVDSKLDKEGNSTENAANVVGSLVGKVTLDGTVHFSSQADSATRTPAGAAGRVTDGKLSMVANLKRTMPDPDQPGKQQVTDIDIKARLFLKPQESTAQTGVQTGHVETATSGKSRSGTSKTKKAAKNP